MKVNDDDKSIFDDEIKKVNNPIFVAWGERAAVKLKSLGYEFLQLPHPSKRNWNNWKLFIFEKAVYHKGVEYAKNIYPDENNSTTTEVIVANEAVEEIHEYCQNVSMCHQDQ